MNKAALLKIVNPVFLVLLLLQAVTGFMMRTMADPPSSVLTIHVWNSYAIGLILFFHLFLNFGWIKANFFTKKKEKGS